MSLSPSELVRDPLFQLNAVLWLAQPLPDTDGIIPLLFRKGFTVYAIAPLLAPPPDVRLAAGKGHVLLQERARPDVVLTHSGARRFSFCECKGGAFASTPQARTLLVVAGARAAEILGLAPHEVSASLLNLVVPETNRQQMEATLTELSGSLAGAGIPPSESSVVGLEVIGLEADRASICVIMDKRGAEFFQLPTGANPFIKFEPGTDARPLYFIPYDPDVSQSDEEAAFCRRVLFERMHSTILAAIGHATVPCELAFTSREVLNDAMFGMYEQWENLDSAKHMRQLCRQFMNALMRAVNSDVPNAVDYRPGTAWYVALQTPEGHEKTVDAVARFSCETLDLKALQPPGLFDNLDEDPPASNAN